MTSASVSGPIQDSAGGPSSLPAPHVTPTSSDGVDAPALSDPLYQAISDFEFDHGDEALTFRDRLARENMWTVEFAALACLEYKKFMYLVCTSDEMLTPSEAVDAVWHQHLVYSESYWIDFCGSVLKRQIHHLPTKGGGLEEIRYRRCYQATLEKYHAAFGAWPDLLFWPSANIRFAASGRGRTVSLNDYYVLQRKTSHVVIINLIVFIVALGLRLFEVLSTESFSIYISIHMPIVILLTIDILKDPITKRNDYKSSGSCGCG
jgi:hypothetical protein